MELKIKPYHKNSYAGRGILVKGNDAVAWLKEVYAMGLNPENTVMYALPGAVANQLFGCLVIPADNAKILDIGRNSFMQCVKDKMYIPQNTILFPELSDAEWTKQFTAAAYVMHPETDLVELNEAINWESLTETPLQTAADIITPSKGVYIPAAIRSFSIEADEQQLAESIENQVGSGDVKELPFNMDKIMKGNEKEIDKLLMYLDKQPEMALKLGIPLDVTGTLRGGTGGGRFVFGRTAGGTQMSDLKIILFILAAVITLFLIISFFASGKGSGGSFPIILLLFFCRFIYQKLKQDTNDSGSGGSAIIATDRFTTLQSRYEKLAQDFVAQKEYQKAAGIYIKLLKYHLKAAQVLEEGGYYAEAGAIYLKYCKDKNKAAACYEKGRLYEKAIDIYKELGEQEKVGDLYWLLNRQKDAEHYYGMVADDYVKNNQYVKASLMYRKKMKMPLKAQGLLLDGWHKNHDAHNCLTNYFTNIEDEVKLGIEIKRFYAVELEVKKREAFLQILKIEFHKHESLKPAVKAMAYEIIAGCIENTPFIASELIAFNQNDKSISKDVMKYKASKMKKN